MIWVLVLLIVAVTILTGIVGYHFLWLVNHDMAIEALQYDRNVILMKMTNRVDGATVSEALDKRFRDGQDIRSRQPLEEM